MITKITAKELADQLERGSAIQLIDVRSAGEYAAGHVPGAMNVPLEQLESRLDDLQQGQVAVLCQSGRRAGIACDTLKDAHRDLLLVEGGTQAWIAEGKPVVRSSAAKWSLERQVRLVAGLMVLVGTVLAVAVHPGWIFLAMFVGAGLTFAGLTDICGMGLLLAKLPWNRAKAMPACQVEVNS